MRNRRGETRMLCAELVDVQWKDKQGKTRRAVANLEDISASGACIQVDMPVPLDTELRITHAKGALGGRVCYCVYREVGYFLGIEFDSGSHWCMAEFCPQFILDPKTLLQVRGAEAGPAHTQGTVSTTPA